MPASPGAQIDRATGAEFPDLARSLFGNVKLEFPEPGSSNQLASALLGDCRISQLQASAHTVVGQQVVARSYDPDAIKLIIQTDGTSELHQSGHRVSVEARTALVYDPTRPYVLVNPGPVKLLMLQMPRMMFSQADLASLCEPMAARADQTGLQPILLSLLASAMAEAARLDARARSALGLTLVELVSAALAGRPERHGQLQPLDMLCHRAKLSIDAHLDQPDFSVADLAQRMGCSPRYVYRAFQAEGTSPSEYLWQRRLERARECLRQASDWRSISEIAFSLGFSSSAHFSRAFRLRYDVSPSTYRSLASASTPPL